MDPPTGICKANALAGKHDLPSNVNDDVRWIIDSSATHHVTYCKSLLGECRKLSDSHHNKFQVPIGNRIHVDHIGDAVILGDCKIKNVLHVPDFRFNLLSVSKLTRDLKCMVSFYPDFCEM